MAVGYPTREMRKIREFNKDQCYITQSASVK